MLRVSKDQYSLLKTNAAAAGGKPVLREPRRPPVKRRVEDLPENQVERLIVDYLQAHGWICTKQHCGTAYRRLSTQVMFAIPKGPADWRAERAIIPLGLRTGPQTTFAVEMFYFETKAPGKKPEPHQQLWLDRRQLTGITTGWFDSFDSFVRWYRKRYGARGGDPPQIRDT